MPDGSADVVLGGKYGLGEVLGTGTYATVYEATELLARESATRRGLATAPAFEPPRRLAAKVLHAHMADDPAARAAFVREARAAARVQQAGLVAVLDVGEDNIAGAHVSWIIMARAPGIPLAQAVGSHRLGLSTALVITSRVLAGLDAAHGAGLVHRDVSPGNVMVELTGGGAASEQVGAVTVLDMGLASAQGQPSVAVTCPDPLAGREAGGVALVIGTPAYMSPEHASGLAVDARGDVYAVGALLYYMLTGHAPFERSDAAAVLRAHVEAPVPVPSARADVPPAVDRLVSRAMAKSPDRRFASAAEMLAAVEGVLGAGTRSSMPRTRALSEAAWRGLAEGTGTTLHSPTEAPARWTNVPALLLLLACGLVGLGWLGTRWEPDSGALAGDRHTAATGAPSASRGSPTTATGAPSASRESPTAATGAPSAPAAATRSTLAATGSTPPPPLPASTAARPDALADPSPMVRVPSLETLGIEQALTQLEAVGLVPGVVSRQDSAKPEGTVLAVDPPPGQQVSQGSLVRLTVSSGQNLVPSVQGLELARVITIVESMGLVPVSVVVSDPVVEPGYVIRVDPAPSTRVTLGSNVTVLVSGGPAPTEPDPEPSATTPPAQPIP